MEKKPGRYFHRADGNGGESMNKELSAEFQKVRNRRVWLIVAALILVQIAWVSWSFHSMSTNDTQQGWMIILYQFSLLNSIVMPVIAAVVASRLSDVEHKGQTLKLLNTIMPTGKLFAAKFLCGALYMFIVAILQVLVVIATGYLRGFEGSVPVVKILYYLFFTTSVNVTILLFQQVLSLFFKNQIVSLSVGLTGGLIGLFIMFFPQHLAKFILWGYYGVLMLVGMDWDPATRFSSYYWAPVDWQGFLMLGLFFAAIYLIGRFLFVRKEI